jgi:hypothetical protein
MATASEKAQHVYWYAESGKSAVTVQRNYHWVYWKTPPSVNSKAGVNNSWRLAVFWIVNVQVVRQHQMILNTASLQEFFTPVFNGIDTGWYFPMHSTIITPNGYRWFPWLNILAHTLGFFRCCSCFLWEISEKKNHWNKLFFRCSFINNKNLS